MSSRKFQYLQISVHMQGALTYYTLIRKLFLQKQIYLRSSIIKMNSSDKIIFLRPISIPVIFQFQSQYASINNILLTIKLGFKVFIPTMIYPTPKD